MEYVLGRDDAVIKVPKALFLIRREGDIVSQMPTVKFAGSIVPPTLLVQANKGTDRWSIPLLGEVLVKCSIRGAVITVECEMEDTSDERITLLHWHALHLVSSIVDRIAFSKGVGVAAVLDHCEKADGSTGPIGLRDDNLTKACPMEHSEIGAIAAKEPAIFQHIHDLVTAILRPWEAQITCARAVEGFKKLMSQGIENQQWKFMRENLNFDKAYLTFVTDLSREARHGHVGSQTLGDITENRMHAWTVAYRFLQFRKRGSVKLPEQEFPRL
jgi:hypothetical protein